MPLQTPEDEWKVRKMHTECGVEEEELISVKFLPSKDAWQGKKSLHLFIWAIKSPLTTFVCLCGLCAIMSNYNLSILCICIILYIYIY